MERVAIISVDGHVKASRAGYRDYVETKYLDDVRRLGARAGGGGAPRRRQPATPSSASSAQWDSDSRVRRPREPGRGGRGRCSRTGCRSRSAGSKTSGRSPDPELDQPGAAGRYNRWLADFCAEAPGRRAGQALVSFDDVDQAVRTSTGPRSTGSAGS